MAPYERVEEDVDAAIRAEARVPVEVEVKLDGAVVDGVVDPRWDDVVVAVFGEVESEAKILKGRGAGRPTGEGLSDEIGEKVAGSREGMGGREEVEVEVEGGERMPEGAPFRGD